MFDNPIAPRGQAPRRRAQPERAIQKAIVDHFRVRGIPGAVMFAIPNGGPRSKVTGALLKATAPKRAFRICASSTPDAFTSLK